MKRRARYDRAQRWRVEGPHPPRPSTEQLGLSWIRGFRTETRPTIRGWMDDVMRQHAGTFWLKTKRFWFQPWMDDVMRQHAGTDPAEVVVDVVALIGKEREIAAPQRRKLIDEVLLLIGADTQGAEAYVMTLLASREETEA